MPWRRRPRGGVRATAHEEVNPIVAGGGGWRGKVLARVGVVVLSADASLVEEVKGKKPSRPEGVPVWSRGGIVGVGEALKSAVRRRFPNGARVREPRGPFNARLDRVTTRAIDVRDGDRVPVVALRALVREAARLNR